MATASYQGLARNYRPQTFADLVGQEAVAQSLMRALEGNRVAHGHILTGPRGVGKTTSARILARALNCVKGPTPVPCGECRHCKAIALGNDMDVIEIDAASNNGVDDIRELNERVILAPFAARYKVYIIDEVHMMSKGAFNALLKTLEEPPDSVVFILATTELEKIPETVRSRCIVHSFRRLSVEDIVRRLGEVVKAEKIKVDEKVAREVFALIAQSAEGGMRDALVALDQILALSGGKLDTQTAQRILGLSSHSTLAETVDWLAEGNSQKLLELINDLVVKGRSLERFIKGLIAYLHDIMLIQAGAGGDLLSLSGEALEQARGIAAKVTQPAIFNMLNQMFELEEKMKRSTQARFLVEFTFLRMSVIKPVIPVKDLINRLQALPDMQSTSAPAAAPAQAEAAPAPQRQSARMTAAAPVFHESAEPQAVAEIAAPSPQPHATTSSFAPESKLPSRGPHSLMGLTREELIETLVPQLPDEHQYLGRYLRIAVAMRAEEGTLRILWPKDDRTSSRMLAKAENQKALEITIKQLCGRELMIQSEFSTDAFQAGTPAKPTAAPPSAPQSFSSKQPLRDSALLEEEPELDIEERPMMQTRTFLKTTPGPVRPALQAAARTPVLDAATSLKILESNSDFARRARMVKDFFSGTFVDQSGRPLAL